MGDIGVLQMNGLTIERMMGFVHRANRIFRDIDQMLGNESVELDLRLLDDGRTFFRPYLLQYFRNQRFRHSLLGRCVWVYALFMDRREEEFYIVALEPDVESFTQGYDDSILHTIVGFLNHCFENYDYTPELLPNDIRSIYSSSEEGMLDNIVAMYADNRDGTPNARKREPFPFEDLEERRRFLNEIPFFLPREILYPDPEYLILVPLETQYYDVPAEEIAPSIFNFIEEEEEEDENLVANGRQESDPFECTICLNSRDPPTDEERHFRSNCRPVAHRFCFPCISEWDRRHREEGHSTRCPFCRSDIIHRNGRVNSS